MTDINYEINEDDDIYLPDNFWDEFKFIFFMLWYIYKHSNERKNEWRNLKRQVLIYSFLLKQEWGKRRGNCSNKFVG